MFYAGEPVPSIGSIAKDAEVGRTDEVTWHVRENYAASASKGVFMATVALDGRVRANLMGNLGTVVGGTGDISIGTTVVPTG